MKRTLSRLVAVLCVLCLMAGSACAATTTILPEKENGYRMTVSMVPVGDTVYILTITGVEAQLYSWNETQTEAATLATGLLYAERFGTIEEMEEIIPSFTSGANADAEHALSMIFTDGEKLYGFNGVNNLVFTIDVADDGLTYTDVVTLPWHRVASRNIPISVQKVGKWILWHEVDSSTRSFAERILAFNTENGTVKQAVLPGIVDVTTYRDGMILAICSVSGSQGAYTVYTYDPETDACAVLGYVPNGVIIDDAVYSAELDMLVYQKSTRIMGWHPETGVEQLGFIPGASAQEIAAMDSSLIYLSGEKVAARSIEKGYQAAHSLLIMDGNLGSAAGSAFSEKHPDVPYYYEYSGADDYARFLTREEDAPDIIRVDAADYDKLVQAGLLLDLSAYPELKAYVDALYPVYKDLAMEGDAILGLPVSASAYNGWFINKKVMTDMGLKAEDIPTSLTEMCAFATKWNDEYAEKYPHYTLLNNTTNYRERLLEAILDSWTDYCQYTGKELTFDDPILREALAALEDASLDKLDAALKQTNPEISEYKQALIWTGIKTVGNWATYMEEMSDRIFIPLTLTEDTPYTAAVETVGIWAVNANSEEADYAAAMLAEVISTMDDVHAYVLRADKTEPVKEKDYDGIMESEMNALAALEARLEDSVNRATIEKRIAEQKDYIENQLEPTLYTIVPSALENYVNVIAPASFIDRPNKVTADDDAQVTGCINRYLQGTYTTDEFINRLNELTAK